LANRGCLSNNITVQSSRSKAKGTRHFFLLDTRQRKENRGNARMTRHKTSSDGEQKSNERVLFSICIIDTFSLCFYSIESGDTNHDINFSADFTEAKKN